jgi:hypothetical protein
MSQALVSEGLPPGMNPSTLEVVLRNGTYSGRNVSYFRVFDPVRIEERTLQVRAFTDLDSYPDLVLGSGHVENDGAIVLSKHHAAQPERTLR